MDGSTIWRSLRDLWESLLERVPYIVVALVVLAVMALAGRLLKRMIHEAGRKTRLDDRLADLLGSLASVAAVVSGVLVAAVIVFPNFRPGDLIAGLGISSIAIGFAFKDILQNWFAGVFLLWRRPFQIGDQIRTREHEGTVEEINVRSTILKTYDGERVVVPNSDVYTNTVLVRTAYGKRRVRFRVGVGYQDSIQVARATIHRTLATTEGVLGDPGPWVYVQELAPSSVDFVVYFWVEAEQANVLRVSDQVATAIKLALDEAGIDMPYPHSVVLLHGADGSRRNDAAAEKADGSTRRATSARQPARRDDRRD